MWPRFIQVGSSLHLKTLWWRWAPTLTNSHISHPTKFSSKNSNESPPANLLVSCQDQKDPGQGATPSPYLCLESLTQLLNSVQFSSVAQSLSHVWLFVTPWTIARQASLSIINSWSLLKLMSIESVMPSNHRLSPSPPTFSIPQHRGLFKWVTSSHHMVKILVF